MLRRHSTKSKSDLHHRKSTSSVRSVPLEHINVAAAQRDAKLAALEAFSRGRDRRAADMALFPPQQASPYDKESNSPTRMSQHRSVSSLNSEHNRWILDRRRSVRFVGPDRGLRTGAPKISTRAIAPGRNSTTQHCSIQHSESIQDVDNSGRLSCNIQESQLSDRTSSRGKAMPSFSSDYAQALEPDNQYYTPEDDVASQPSSYRRLRKSKSISTPRYHSKIGCERSTGRSASSTPLPQESKNFSSPSIWPRLSFLHRKNSDLTLPMRTVKARKSTSFVRHRRDHASAAAATPGAARHTPTNLIDPPLPESSSRSRLLSKPSSLFASKDTRAGRSSSNNILHISETTSSVPLSVHGSMRAKARKTSSSIKTRLKNLFVNKSEFDDSLPAQHVVAQRTHLSINSSHHESEMSRLAAFPKRGSLGSELLTKSSLSRIMPRIPSLTAVPSNELLQSRKGSIESLKSMKNSLSDEKSRVTSWASTEANTVVAHKSLGQSEEHEKQLLSVISENELQAVSSIVGPPMSHSMPSEEEPVAPGDQEPGPRRPVVDSQRVYSALMKRMNDTRQIAELVAQQRKSSDNSDPFRTLSPPTSDDSSRDSSSPVISQEHICLENSKPTRLSSGARDTSCGLVLNAGSGCHRPLSPPVYLNPKGADLVPAVPRADRSSAFFGSPTSYLFRTRSAWRRSLQEAIGKEQASPPESRLDETSFAVIKNVTEINDKVDSASIYSQESQIHKPELHREFPVAGGGHFIHSDEDKGTLPNVLSHYRTGERVISTASSTDWQTRLSYDVAKEKCSSLSPTRVSGRASEVQYVVPTMPKALGLGHVREEAQIETHDEDEGHASPSVRLPTKGTTPLGVVEPNVVKLTPQQRSVVLRTPPPVPVRYETMSAVVDAETEASLLGSMDAARPNASSLNSSNSGQNIKQGTSKDPQAPAHKMASGKQIRPVFHEPGAARFHAEETGSPRREGSPTVRLSRKTVTRQEHASAASAASTPHFSRAFERQFGGSLPRGRPSCDLVEKENQSPHGEDHIMGLQRTGSPGSKGHIGKSSTTGDVLLSGRYRQRTSGNGVAFV